VYAVDSPVAVVVAALCFCGAVFFLVLRFLNFWIQIVDFFVSRPSQKCLHHPMDLSTVMLLLAEVELEPLLVPVESDLVFGHLLNDFLVDVGRH
jgi:hypothetical protein